MKRFKKALFLFHRDLRLVDNKGLQAAVDQAHEVMPVFIIDPIQVEDTNRYRSANAVQFMVESLENLAQAFHKAGGKLFIFYGPTQKVIEDLLKKQSIDAVFCNRDYTPFALKRDAALQKLVKHHKGECIITEDALLTDVDQIFTGSGTPYTIYSAFLKKAVQSPVASCTGRASGNFLTTRVTGQISLEAVKRELYVPNPTLFQTGGATAGLGILKKIGDFKHYTTTRDYPSLLTTGLSAHLKFGTVSARQAYEAIKEHKADTQLIKQLYWRDFFTYLGYHFPYVFEKAFVKKYQSLPWSHTAGWFDRWCEGMTGFPLVDAGMRQLNATGYMHNRVRMVVASFLTKDLHISWQKGERYFAQQLTDYDPCVNNGNWQWSASTGADAQPYFRIFNPWLQQKKFDPECTYIKEWIPEIADLSAKAIHAWFKSTATHKGYPLPLVDHAVESRKAISLFRNGASKE